MAKRKKKEEELSVAQMEDLYTFRQAGKKCGVSASFLNQHLSEFRNSGLIQGLRERKSDRAKLIPESDVIRLRRYLTEDMPVFQIVR